jgi:hypothetical protein
VGFSFFIGVNFILSKKKMEKERESGHQKKGETTPEIVKN